MIEASLRRLRRRGRRFVLRIYLRARWESNYREQSCQAYELNDKMFHFRCLVLRFPVIARLPVRPFVLIGGTAGAAAVEHVGLSFTSSRGVRGTAAVAVRVMNRANTVERFQAPMPMAFSVCPSRGRESFHFVDVLEFPN